MNTITSQTNTEFGSSGYLNSRYRDTYGFYYMNSNFPVGIFYDSSKRMTNWAESCNDCVYDACNCLNYSSEYAISLGDELVGTDYSFTKKTIGLIYKLPKFNFLVYSGYGFGQKFYGYKFKDSDYSENTDGRYWINADRAESYSALSIGGIYYISLSKLFTNEDSKNLDFNLGVNFGYETMPATFILGLNLDFLFGITN